MPKVMTVDDSRAVRSIVSRQMTALGCEVFEAEDGAQGLAKLKELTVDLILLDVTMPVMDGPEMLAALRASGNKTPVIMLTSESKKSVIGDAMRQGIDDYIFKPFKQEELVAKACKSLKLTPPPPAPAAAAADAPTADAKQGLDVLVIDDMENVIARLRTLLPPALGVHGVTTARDAITTMREKTVKVALIDYELPDVTAAQFTSQLKLLQPSTVLLAMTLRGSAPPGVLAAEARAKGFADVLFKPFSPESIEDFLQQHFAPKDVLSREDNVLKVPAFAGSAERQEKYFTQLASLIAPELETIASACFAGAVLDLSRAPFNAERIPRLMKQVGEKAKAMGLNLCLVGSPEVRAALREFEETKDLRIFGGLAEARAEAG